MNSTRLRVTEIFYSLQGETSRVGLPTVFIRLTGCPLRCSYCDTAYAFQGGQWLSLEAVMAEVRRRPSRYDTGTGGVPLAQRDCPHLLTRLCDEGYFVSLETSGAIDLAEVDPRVMKVIDIKTPGSGEADRNLWSNLGQLTPADEIKFVLTDRADYDWAKTIMNRYDLAQRCAVLFSPVHDGMEPHQLADWILCDKLPVRMQLQLHKILWGEAQGR